VARSDTYRWNGWHTDLDGGSIKDRPVESPKKKPKKPKGITNSQAKYLAALQRKAGERYSGNGLTAKEASAEIKRLTGGERTNTVR
jgi:hypothetical protein